MIFRTCPDRPWDPPSLLYNGYRIFPGDKERPGCDADPSPILVPWSRKSRAIPLLPLWAVRPVQSLSACTTVHFTFTYTSIPPMDRTACTEPQCLYNGALYLYLYLYSPYGPYGLYRASVPVQGYTLPFYFSTWSELSTNLTLSLVQKTNNLRPEERMLCRGTDPFFSNRI